MTLPWAFKVMIPIVIFGHWSPLLLSGATRGAIEVENLTFYILYY